MNDCMDINKTLFFVLTCLGMLFIFFGVVAIYHAICHESFRDIDLKQGSTAEREALKLKFIEALKSIKKLVFKILKI